MIRRTLATIAALTATGVLAACGGSSGGSGGASGGKQELRIAYQAFPSGDLIVKDQQLLEKALPEWKITWSKFDSGADINTAFLGKSLDIAAIGSSPVARGLSAPLNPPTRSPGCSTWPATTRPWWPATAPASRRSPL